MVGYSLVDCLSGLYDMFLIAGNEIYFQLADCTSKSPSYFHNRHDDHFSRQYGFWRPYVEQVIYRYLHIHIVPLFSFSDVLPSSATDSCQFSFRVRGIPVKNFFTCSVSSVFLTEYQGIMCNRRGWLEEIRCLPSPRLSFLFRTQWLIYR